MPTLKNTNINYTFKLLYALGIIFVVAGHCNGGGFSIFYEFFPVYTFHLGLFMFASGYFYNSENELNVKSYIIKKIKHLILPLYLWNIFYACLIYILNNFGFFNCPVTLKTIFISPILHGHQFVLNTGGWFIIPLFMIHIINILTRKIFAFYKIKINETLYFIISLLLGLLGAHIAYLGYNTSLYLVIDRVLYFIPFYSLGIFYRNNENHDRIPSIIYFSIIISIVLSLLFINNGAIKFTPSWCTNFPLNPLYPFIVGFLGIAFWLRVAKILEPIIGKNKYVNIIANNTYSIMINHLLGFMLIKTLFAYISKYSVYFHDFDIYKYKTDVFYCYLPHNLSQMLILYLIIGISFPIIFQFVINRLKISIIKYKSN